MKVIALLNTLLALLAYTALTSHAKEPSQAPSVFNVQADTLSPEDCAFDIANKRWFQSNLYRGKIHVAGMDGSSFEVSIPKISSDEPFKTPYQLAGLSLDSRTNPTRLYGVAKDKDAFRFKSDDPTQSVSKRGPNRFVAYDLPIKSSSTPAWSIRLDGVQDRLEKELGGKNRPFGPVDAVQDDQGNSYIAFALGAPAIAKVSPSGKTIQAWAWEQPKSSRQPRVGYTGITYDRSSNRLIAFGGPRVLTMFDLSATNPGTPIPVKIEGDLSVSDLTSAEKINLIPSTDGTGPRLLATNAPNVYSFRSSSSSTNPWSKVTFKQTSKDVFNNNGLTVVCEANFKDADGKRARQIYGQGAYFGEGAYSGRTQWPMYKLPARLLTA